MQTNFNDKAVTGPAIMNPSLYHHLLLLLIVPILVIPKVGCAGRFKIQKDPQSYVLEKLKSHDIVFLGTTHRRQPILKFLSDLIPHLHESGVTHLGLEICSDQQDRIDSFLQTGSGLRDIALHFQMECPEYRNIFNTIRGVGRTERPVVLALDLPKSMYNREINRDKWMAGCIAKVFHGNPNAKVLVVVGNLHVLKKIEWEDKVPNPHGFIRSYLNEMTPYRRMFSIGECIDKRPDECDFTREFSSIEYPVPFDCDRRFDGWNAGIMASVAAKPSQIWELLDGIIVY
jgi:hypothetical protein